MPQGTGRAEECGRPTLRRNDGITASRGLLKEMFDRLDSTASPMAVDVAWALM